MYCQFSIIGFNFLLTEKLLKEYSFVKNLKFYISLLIFSEFFVSLAIYGANDSLKRKRKKKKLKKKNETNENNEIKRFRFLNMYFFFSVFVYLNVFFIFTFICSIYYSIEENTSRERWNNIIMAEFIIFKIIDLLY